MLGEELGHEEGRVTSRRVLEGDDFRYLKMEVTYEASSTILGKDAMNAGTYTLFGRVPGQIYAEGRGILTTSDGENAIWNGHGVGRQTGEGLGFAFAASVAFQAGAGALERLNGVLVVVEHETAADGTVRSTLWEWKV